VTKSSHVKPSGVNDVNNRLSRSVIKITSVMQATSQSLGSKLHCIFKSVELIAIISSLLWY